MVLHELLSRILQGPLSLQRHDGSLPPGHNGPYSDPETPVRVTAHFLLAFLRVARLTGDDRYLQAARRCLDFLLQTDALGFHNYHQRTKPGKDRCNGLVGPAWAIEALLAGAAAFERTEATALARRLFLGHPFLPGTGVWQRVETDGTNLGVDGAFNHQLWLAAAAAPLAAHDPEVASRLATFLDRLERTLALRRTGRIVHKLQVGATAPKEALKALLRPAYRRYFERKERGYHAFNTLAFGMLYRVFPHHPFFQSLRFRRVLDYLEHPDYLSGLEDSEYGFPYNPPGFEVPATWALTGRERPPEAVASWLNRQFQWGLRQEQWDLGGGTADPVTATARVYELIHLPDSWFRLDIRLP